MTSTSVRRRQAFPIWVFQCIPVLVCCGLFKLMSCPPGSFVNTHPGETTVKRFSPNKEFVATERDHWDDNDAYVDMEICRSDDVSGKSCELVGPFPETFDFFWKGSRTLEIESDRESRSALTKSGIRIVYKPSENSAKPGQP